MGLRIGIGGIMGELEPVPVEEFTTEYQLYYDALPVKPSASIAWAQDLFFKTLVINGIWDRLDWMPAFAQTTSAGGLINCINPGTNNPTIVNDPLFTALEGFTTDGLSKYINSNWKMITDGVNYTLNDCSFGFYIRNNVATDEVAMGVRDDTPGLDQVTYITPRAVSDGKCYLRCNETMATYIRALNADSRGMWIGNRTAVDDYALYKNTMELISGANVTSNLTDLEFFIGAMNDDGVAANHTPYQFSMAFTGGGLTPVQTQVLTNAFEAYMESNGKGVPGI